MGTVVSNDRLSSALRSIPLNRSVGQEAAMLISCSNERLDKIEDMLNSLSSRELSSPTTSSKKHSDVKKEEKDKKKVSMLRKLYGI
jgi:hypothetical protein